MFYSLLEILVIIAGSLVLGYVIGVVFFIVLAMVVEQIDSYRYQKYMRRKEEKRNV